MNARLPCLILFCVFCTSFLRAQDSSGSPADTNVPLNSATLELTNQASVVSVPKTETVQTPAAVTNAPSQADSAQPVMETPREQARPVTQNSYAPAGDMEPRRALHSDDSLVWIALVGVSVISFSAIIISWQTSRKSLAVAPVPPAQTPATIAPALLPVISQAIKEALVQELSAQRRELLAAQQSAAAELSQLARRLEAVQTPLLERLGGPRSAITQSTKFPREIPVKIYCSTCGQKYSFEVQPVDGHMPFTVVCPACGQDGTHQANQVILRLMNGITQPLPAPGNGLYLNSSQAIAPQLVDAVKQAVVNELAAPRAEAPRPAPPAAAPMAVVPEHKNGSSSPANHLEHPPENVAAKLLAEGQSLVDSGELDKAVKCFDTALILQPHNADALAKMGAVLDKLGRADEALQFYDRAIALDESMTIAYLNKGGLFNRLARYDEALRCYEQALLKQKKAAA